jgi:hypothetical protein
MIRRLLTSLALAALAANGQTLKLEALEKLADKASETVNVTLNESLLRLASRFLSDSDADQAQIKKLVTGLKGIYVRSFEFEQTGEYQQGDVDAIRGQLRDPKWNKIVEFRNKNEGESADVYLRQETDDRISGLVLISAEPKEFTVVDIEGPIDMDGLVKLAGNFGIPEDLHLPKKVEKKK